jgi:hypothetical protein
VWAHWKVEQDQKGNEKTQTSIESFNKFNYRVDLLLKLSDGSSVFSQVPPTLAPANALKRYAQILSLPLRKMNKQGDKQSILSIDIHPLKVSFFTSCFECA